MCFGPQLGRTPAALVRTSGHAQDPTAPATPRTKQGNEDQHYFSSPPFRRIFEKFSCLFLVCQQRPVLDSTLSLIDHHTGTHHQNNNISPPPLLIYANLPNSLRIDRVETSSTLVQNVDWSLILAAKVPRSLVVGRIRDRFPGESASSSRTASERGPVLHTIPNSLQSFYTRDGMLSSLDTRELKPIGRPYGLSHRP